MGARTSMGIKAVAAAAIGLALSCSSQTPVGVLVPNQSPVIRLSAAPAPGDSVFYVVQFTWFSYDPDGEVVGFRYAVDPPVEGDTAWVAITEHELTLRFASTRPDSGGSTGIVGSDYHVFAIEALDNGGLASPAKSVAFTSYTIAPTVRLTFPSPSRLITAITQSSLHLSWTGTDPDGQGAKQPVQYRFHLDSRTAVQQALGLGSLNPTASQLQEYFSRSAPTFADWDSSGADKPSTSYEALTPGEIYYFAVVAFDDAKAYDPRFDLDRNLLRFRPSLEVQGPRLEVFNDLFTASSASLDFSEERVAHFSVPAGEVVRFDWSATPPPGGTIVGYRWILDPINGDVSDETPRDDYTQTYRWSTWALLEQAAILGPFLVSGDDDEFHRFYVEARDISGSMSLVQVEIRVVPKARDLLVIDDFQANPDKDFGSTNPASFQPYGNFPTEAILDTLLFAVGGKSYRYRPPGTLSSPGMFSGFDYDTLDYRFRTSQDIPIDLLVRYRAVVIFTSMSDALRPVPALCALRQITFRQSMNPLAAYLRHGGKVWLFGDGLYYGLQFPPGVGTQLQRTPAPGTFAYDYMKLRSTFSFGGGSSTIRDYLDGAVPYLPEHATPGRPWPPDTVRAYTPGPCDDPRVGPAAVRNRARWDGLPCLTLTREFLNWPSGFPAGAKTIGYVGIANRIIEDVDPGPGTHIDSALDTLYLYHQPDYVGAGRASNPDGKPVMCAYEGLDNGPVVWTGMPLWFLDREEIRQLAAVVLGSFGINRQANPALVTGPGSANGYGERVSVPAFSVDARPAGKPRPGR